MKHAGMGFSLKELRKEYPRMTDPHVTYIADTLRAVLDDLGLKQFKIEMMADGFQSEFAAHIHITTSLALKRIDLAQPKKIADFLSPWYESLKKEILQSRDVQSATALLRDKLDEADRTIIRLQAINQKLKPYEDHHLIEMELRHGRK